MKLLETNETTYAANDEALEELAAAFITSADTLSSLMRSHDMRSKYHHRNIFDDKLLFTILCFNLSEELVESWMQKSRLLLLAPSNDQIFISMFLASLDRSIPKINSMLDMLSVYDPDGVVEQLNSGNYDFMKNGPYENSFIPLMNLTNGKMFNIRRENKKLTSIGSFLMGLMFQAGVEEFSGSAPDDNCPYFYSSLILRMFGYMYSNNQGNLNNNPSLDEIQSLAHVYKIAKMTKMDSFVEEFFLRTKQNYSK